MSDSTTALYRFAAPRYWPVWLGLAGMRAGSWLPHGARMRLGRRLGAALYRKLAGRREIARRNIARCFAELGEPARRALLEAHFASLGIGLLEAALAWWAAERRIMLRVRFEGLEHLERALDAGRGVILLSAHFTTMDLGVRALGSRVSFDALYRPLGHPLFDEVMRRGRQRGMERALMKQDLRGMLRSLASNRAVWFAPDQAHAGANSARVPFFGVPAPTNTIISRLARRSGAQVIPFFPRREPDGYRMTVLPALEAFPGTDAAADAACMNRLVEAQVRLAPEQYLWIHRRFKGEPGMY
ncbi:MAG TPA: lipid A biosynthesis acyltransferase [Gammaproteobacteria bacterium]|nr:lipid A biosynthesis acyltransferase [Gammaproteobacteria bacterium]